MPTDHTQRAFVFVVRLRIVADIAGKRLGQHTPLRAFSPTEQHIHNSPDRSKET